MTQPIPNSQSAQSQATLYHSSLTLKTNQWSTAKNAGHTQWLLLDSASVCDLPYHSSPPPGSIPEYCHSSSSRATAPPMQSNDLHYFIWFPAGASGWLALFSSSTLLPLSHPLKTGSSFRSFMNTSAKPSLSTPFPLCIHTYTCTHTHVDMHTHTHRWSCSHSFKAWTNYSFMDILSKHLTNYCNVPYIYLSLPSD